MRANQRTRVTLADGSCWIYEYDKLGQVTLGKRYWSDGTPVAGQQFEYAFDDIGNRNSTKAGGDANGANLRSATYTANRLNQYSSRTVPSAVDVLGAAKATASVTVNSAAAYERGEYFHKEVSVSNGSGPAYPSITVTATDGSSSNQTGNILVPPATQNFSHDADGNLTNDSVWSYTWDGENRLVRMVVCTAVGPQQRLDFEYDWRGRRISKKVWNNTAGTGSPAVDQRFLYDGWNLLAIVDSGGAASHSFQWGTDLSGSLQGAGGVGGLISMKVHSGGNAGTYFYTYDGNGNVVSLASAANGSVAGAHEYGAFGEPIRATGPLAQSNPFRFSTKFSDENDSLYYGNRYYGASIGRWSNRDPIAERDGANLYAFNRNDSVGGVDKNGLISVSTTKKESKPCESTIVQWRFTLDRPAACDGFIVIENKQYTIVKQCGDCPNSIGKEPTSVFYEAFPVKKGEVVHDWEDALGFSDQGGFTLGKGLKKTCGISKVVGTIKFFCQDTVGDLRELWRKQPGDTLPTVAPATGTQPDWWNSKPEEGPATRGASTRWKCDCPCQPDDWGFGTIP